MGISLRSLLIVPFVLQIVGITSLIGYLSYRSGQQAVEGLAHQLLQENGDLIAQDLEQYLQSAHNINRSNIAALRSGALPLENLDQLHRYLTLQLFENAAATTLLLGTPQGDFRATHRVTPDDYGVNTQLTASDPPFEVGLSTRDNPATYYLYSVDSAGNPDRYLETLDNLDVRDRPWYRLAVSTRQPGWSEPFQIGSTQHLAINAYAPFGDGAQQLQGVVAVNLSLQQLSNFLAALTADQSGQAFIMQPNGLLIANSTGEPAYRIQQGPTSADASPSAQQQPGSIQFQRLSAADSQNPVIRLGFQEFQSQIGTLDAVPSAQKLSLMVDGDRHFLHLTPYQDDYGLEWLIVTTVPQSELMGTIRANVRRAIIFCGLALLGSIGFGVWMTRRITRPLQDLSATTQAYTDGQSLRRLPPTWIAEIEVLRRALTTMMQEIDAHKVQIETVHADYARSLEQKIADRTAALAATTQKLRDAQRIAQVGSWEFDVVTQKLSWSEELFRIFRRDPAMGEPAYDEVLDLLLPADQAALRAAMAQAIATGESYAIEQQIIRPEGALCYLLNRGEAQLNEVGQVIKLSGTIADITERKRAEQALAASESRRRLALELTNTGSWEFEIKTGKANWSDSHYRLLGLVPGEAIPSYQTWCDCVHPDDLVTTEQALQAAIDNGTALYVEHRVVHSDGQIYWVLAQGQATYDDNGIPLNMVGVTIDIHDRKQADLKLTRLTQVLAEWRDRYEVATRTGRQIIFEYDVAHDHYTFSQNAQDILRCEPAALPKTLQDSFDLTHPDDLPILQQAIARASQLSDRSYCIEIRLRQGDGTYLWLEDQGTLQVNDQGGPTKVIGSLKDISDRKQIEAERDEAMAKLRASEASYLDILQHQTELINRFSVDTTLLFVNNAFCEYFSVEAADVIGQKHFPHVYPDDRRKIYQCLDRLSPAQPYSSVEHRVIVQGEIRWMHWTNRAIYDQHNHLVEFQAVGRDIDDRKRAEESLQASQAKFQRLVDDIGEKFVVFSHTGADGILTYVSDGIESVFGLPKNAVIGKSWAETVNWLPESTAKANASLQDILQAQIDFQQFEMEFIHPNGTHHTLLISQHPVKEAAGHLIAIEGIAEDITERKQAELELQLLNAQLRELATTDSLTKVANRRQFLSVLTQEWQRHQRELMPLTLIMIDIDHFKAFNDSYGHPAGDVCLTQIAHGLKTCMCRPGDLVARYGGEEFIVLLPNTPHEGAIAMAQRIQQGLADMAIPHQTSPTANRVTISSGIVVVNMPAQIDSDLAISKADKMLYKAKQIRNTYCVEEVLSIEPA